MGNKMKGIFKGFKIIFNNFAAKERELEIGCPTDVKHVAHIGWDGPSGNAPSWMNQFKKGPDFAAASIGNSGSSLSPWTSQGVGESNKEVSIKKQRRRKSKASSSQKSSPSSKFVERQSKSTNIQVAKPKNK
ncbi:unnamed protein product [Withania somnifera]